MTSRMHWIHEDALSHLHPVLRGRTDADRVCFVWDDAHLAAMEYSFQRLVFIYETLCEMEVEIIRGDTVQVLLAGAQECNADTIRVPASPNPALQAFIDTLGSHLTVDVIAPSPFVALERPPSLRRFFAYWKSARSQLMRP